MKHFYKWSNLFKICLNALLILLVAISLSEMSQAAEETPLIVEIVSGSTYAGADNEVIGALKKLLHALEQKSIEQISTCLSADVTTCDSKSGKALYGKEAVLEHVKKNFLGKDKNGRSAVKRMVVYDPYVRVNGETAMISFRATKELGDGSTKLESWCSEVYERKNGDWLVLRLKTDWKPIKGE